jgi:trk system potassium uptake protein TrkH
MLKNKRTYLIPIIGFAFIILVASVILCSPICNYKEITFRDALFIATSGLTTTGFTKGPLVEQFNFLGQIILAILMEIGAMGFIIFISYFWSIKNKKMKISDILVINDNISSDSYGQIKEHSIFIGKIMLEVQAFGIILLAIRFIPLLGFFKGIWYSIFHTISAFSNCGFDLFGGNSFRIFSNDIYVQTIMIALMLLGSIGILVIEDVRNNKSRKFSRLKLQTKIILTYSLILLVVPTIAIKILEPNISILNSLFMVSTSRSTGFSVVDLPNFTFESKFILIILMFIGGSPTSTSGGVKMVTIAVLISTIVSTLKGKDETIMFWKKVPNSAIRRAITIFTLFALIITIACTVFYHYNKINLLNIIFEAVSAISNTGLTITDYSTVNIIGENILLLLMFIGRVSPLSFILVFINENSKDKYIDYPSENVIL